VAVVAPGGMVKTGDLESGINLLVQWGFNVVPGKHARDRHLFHAGALKDRAADLVWALSDPAIDAVWLARGGYGCSHCLPAISGKPFDNRPVIGFSDATALFCALSKSGHTGLVHGPVLGGLAEKVDEATRTRVHELLLGRKLDPIPGRHMCGPNVVISGPLVGGNLCMMASLAGTPWALDARGAILVLEDVGEAAYRVHRLIKQLVFSGAFEGVKAVALGEFVSCSVPEGSGFSMEEVLIDALAPLGLPVFAGFAIGHGARNLAWRWGAQAVLEDGGLHFAQQAWVP